jgi:hypothetical protein
MLENPWHALRKILNPDLSTLKDDPVSWLLSFPPEMRPDALAKKHPSLVNKLTGIWNKPAIVASRLDAISSGKEGRKPISDDRNIAAWINRAFISSTRPQVAYVGALLNIKPQPHAH